MEFQQVVRRRRMVRSFQDRRLGPGVLDRILENARRGPSAGFSQGFAFVVLEGREETDRFWRHASEEGWRHEPDFPGLLLAPVIIVPLAHKRAYLDRYAEPDKAGAGLEDEEAWPVPFWTVDTAFAAMLILLSAVDAGVGALFFGLLHAEQAAMLEAFGIPADYQPIGAIALGYPAADDRPTGSVHRGHRPAAEIIHRGGW
jgi:nitroreductase